VLHARPLTRPGLHVRIVEEEVPPIPAVARYMHRHPVVVVIETVRDVVLFRCHAEPVTTDRFDPCLGVRPGERRVVPSHPDSSMVILPARRIVDVVADIEHAVDAGAQLFVEMAAVVDSPADPRDIERTRAGAAGWHIRTERHRRTIEYVRPPGEEIGERGLLELFDEDYIWVVLNAHVSRVERGDSVPVGIGNDEKKGDGEDQSE